MSYGLFGVMKKGFGKIKSLINPRSVAVNHAGLWIRRHQFESGRGYRVFMQRMGSNLSDLNIPTGNQNAWLLP